MDLCARVYERSGREEGRGAWIYVQECEGPGSITEAMELLYTSSQGKYGKK
jgi:hypothetical protein